MGVFGVAAHLCVFRLLLVTLIIGFLCDLAMLLVLCFSSTSWLFTGGLVLSLLHFFSASITVHWGIVWHGFDLLNRCSISFSVIEKIYFKYEIIYRLIRGSETPHI